MIALVTSTLIPPTAISKFDIYRNKIDPRDRMIQTKLTIESLCRIGIEKIYIADNSVDFVSEEVFDSFPNVEFLRLPTFQFINKGLSELFLLDSALKFIDVENVPILKLSGRYTISESLQIDVQKDFLVKLEGVKYVSTRCYVAANKEIFLKLVVDCIHYYLNYKSLIKGPKSMLRIFQESVKDPGIFNVELMLEYAMRSCLQKYNVQSINYMGVKGKLGGGDLNENIHE